MKQDITLDDFSNNVLRFQDDYNGKVVATLIKLNRNIKGKQSVLYIHGFNDYFFHPHLAEAFYRQDYNFYALELRKYGHSLMPHQHPNYCKRLEEYFEEISEALSIIDQENKNKIVLLAHSFGGLVASLYMNSGKNQKLVNALVLNSPFFEFNTTLLNRIITSFLAWFISSVFPYSKLEGLLSSYYAKSIHKDFQGEWEFNTAWKPIKGFPAYFSWLKAVSRGHKRLKKNSNITVPVLVMHSSRSVKPKKWDNELLESDTVLNVNDIKHISKTLGSNITIVEIKRSLHDVFLSKKEVRGCAINKMIKWLDNINFTITQA